MNNKSFLDSSLECLKELWTEVCKTILEMVIKTIYFHTTLTSMAGLLTLVSLIPCLEGPNLAET